MFYIQPGMPPPTSQASQPNAYIQPGGPLHPPQAPNHEPPRGTLTALFAEWRTHHASDWVKADALDPAVRRLIDARVRFPAVRQKLRQLVSTHLGGFKLEARIVGNAARPVTLYRLVEVA